MHWLKTWGVSAMIEVVGIILNNVEWAQDEKVPKPCNKFPSFCLKHFSHLPDTLVPCQLQHMSVWIIN